MNTSLPCTLCVTLLLLAISAPALAQAPPASPHELTQQDPASYPITVQVSQQGKPLGGALVSLSAARVKGPFEPTEPEPSWEQSAKTDASGLATFATVPQSLAAQGLKLHASVTHDGMTFKSAAATPTANLKLTVPIYKRGSDYTKLEVSSLRMIVEPWEDYLVFTQMWSLSVSGDTAVDTSIIPHSDYVNGIPLELPVKAQGINAMASEGEAKTVNSTIYWKGVVRPGQPVTFQMRYSMAANGASFVYEQPLSMPVKSLQIIIPLETNYKEKLPRMNALELRAPGFKAEDIKSGYNIPGLRPDKEFLYAQRADIPANGSLLFRLDNLPYAREQGPFIALIIGLLAALAVFGYALVEQRKGPRSEQLEVLLANLIAERDSLLAHLELLRKALDHGEISEREYDAEEIPLRGRAAIILSKIDELQARLPSGQTAAP